MDDETKKMLGEILSAVKGLEGRVAKIETAGDSGATTISAPPQTKNQQRLSVKEFLMEYAPTDDVQKTLTIAYHLETHEAMTSFNKADLEKGFRSAKEPIPSNINDKVNMSIKNGHMMEAEEKKESMKAWVITRTGEQYLKNSFKKEARR